IIENKTTTTIEEIKKSVLINGPMKCSKVIDGDTIKVVDDKGEEYLVQYVGIDIPEDFDDEAKNINEALLLNKNIELEKDISETDEGGRLLRYVYVEDIFVNAYLVEEGLAKVDTISPDKKYEDTLLKLEGKAKDSLLGFWASELTVSQTTKSQETTTTIQQETTTTIEQSTTTTTQAQVYGVEIISLTSPVAQGANATIGISTAPGAMCNITVYYKSGPSEAQGLFPKQADGNGNCSWTWKVGTRTTPGDWRIVINVDGIGSKEIYFTVVG
ncbi:MAG: thermonuclease family protein, partial [Actinomycetota bacterium]|nr:thermonuclease family protein [Actinomycetota bacterium]